MNKAEFITPFLARDITTGMETNLLQLEADFRVYSGTLDAIINVPNGFVFQESIPQAAQGFTPVFGASKRAACLHDFLYKHAGYLDAAGKFHKVTRSQADGVYREICEAAGLSWWRARFRWSMLRTCGWAAWRKCRSLDPQEEPETVIFTTP